MTELPEGYDFKGAVFDLETPKDRQILCFVLSQALYGEATGVYCGKSLFGAYSLEAARFYTRQARQELGHLQMFADIFRALELQPQKAHWIIRLLSSHNNYYPLKVLMEHAIGEGMVLDIFKDVLLQTLPDADPRVLEIKKKLLVICREEAEHVAWGEKESKFMLKRRPWLETPYYGLVQMQLIAVRWLAKRIKRKLGGHPVVDQLPDFIHHVEQRILAQGKAIGFVPDTQPNLAKRLTAILWGLLLYLRSQFSRSESKIDKIYRKELGFEK
ncbi:MAG: ferritin-like domain-containing protein [Myxococcales bacterium]|nr:MAG: ferritin-like domain-containing protein [Myxococcales bacterium]